MYCDDIGLLTQFEETKQLLEHKLNMIRLISKRQIRPRPIFETISRKLVYFKIKTHGIKKVRLLWQWGQTTDR